MIYKALVFASFEGSLVHLIHPANAPFWETVSRSRETMSDFSNPVISLVLPFKQCL